MNTLQDYSIYNLPRPTCRGGGVAVVARKGLAVKQNQTTVVSSFEHLELVVTSRNKSFRLLTIYRPPSKKNKLTPDKFFSEFSILLEDLIASPHQLLLSGVFNFHVDDTRNLINAMKFLDLITSADLRQHYPASRGPSIFLDIKSGRRRDLCQPPRLSHPPKRMSQSGLKPVFPVFAQCASALLEIAD